METPPTHPTPPHPSPRALPARPPPQMFKFAEDTEITKVGEAQRICHGTWLAQIASAT